MIKVGRIFSGWWRKSVTKAEPINQLQSAAVKNNAADTFTRMCECRYSYDPSGFTVFGDFPENYVFTDRLWVEAKPAKYSHTLKKNDSRRAGALEYFEAFKAVLFFGLSVFSRKRSRNPSG